MVFSMLNFSWRLIYNPKYRQLYNGCLLLKTSRKRSLLTLNKACYSNGNFYPSNLKIDNVNDSSRKISDDSYGKNVNDLSNKDVNVVNENSKFEEDQMFHVVEKYIKTPEESKPIEIENIVVKEEIPLTPIECLKLLEEFVTKVKENNLDYNQYSKDKQFITLENYLNGEDFNKWHLPTLPVMYKHLMDLYMDENSPLIQKIISTIKWQMPRGPINASLLCYILQNQYNMKTEVLNESKEVLNDRISEISSSRTISRVLGNKKLFSDNFLFTVDKNVLTLIENFTTQECLAILTTYSEAKRRSVFVLAAIARRLAVEENLLPKDVANILFVLSEFNFEDQLLFDNMANIIVNKVDSIDKSSIVSSILTSVGRLRWKNPGVLDILSRWVADNYNNCLEKDIVGLVRTLSTVNYQPKNKDKLIECVNNQHKFNDPILHVDFVWGLTILGWVQPSHLESLFSSQEIKNIENLSFKTKGAIRKLQNISTVAQNIPNYKGPVYNSKEIINMPERKNKLQLQELITQCLKASFPPPLYLNSKTQNPVGISFLAEILVDKTGKGLPLKGYASNFKDPKFNANKLKGMNKIIIMVWDYHDYTIGEVGLLGHNELALKILKDKGYSCVEISYSELSSLHKVLDRISLITKKIKDISKL